MTINMNNYYLLIKNNQGCMYEYDECMIIIKFTKYMQGAPTGSWFIKWPIMMTNCDVEGESVM